jgi:hypothetical protein
MEELGNNLLVYGCIVKVFVQYYNASCVGWWNHAQFIKQCKYGEWNLCTEI